MQKILGHEIVVLGVKNYQANAKNVQ